MKMPVLFAVRQNPNTSTILPMELHLVAIGVFAILVGGLITPTTEHVSFATRKAAPRCASALPLRHVYVWTMPRLANEATIPH